MPAAKMLAEHFAGLADVAEIRLASFRQRCRDANNHGVHVLEAARVGGRLKSAGADQLGHSTAGDVTNVTLAGLQLLDLLAVDIKTNHWIPAPGEGLGQGKTDVTQPDHGHAGDPHFDSKSELL